MKYGDGTPAHKVTYITYSGVQREYQFCDLNYDKFETFIVEYLLKHYEVVPANSELKARLIQLEKSYSKRKGPYKVSN